MKLYTTTHKTKEIANTHIAKIKERGGEAFLNKENNVIRVNYWFPQITLFEGLKRSDIQPIIDYSFKYLEKTDKLVEYIQNHLYKTFAWSKNNDIIDILKNKSNKYEGLIYTLVPYHEVVEYLASNDGRYDWNYTHPVAVAITGNKLKRLIPKLIDYSNQDIQEVSEYLTRGKQKSGNELIDNYPIKLSELNNNQKKIVKIIKENNEMYMFDNVSDILFEITKQTVI